jgi:hypothetical protein
LLLCRARRRSSCSGSGQRDQHTDRHTDGHRNSHPYTQLVADPHNLADPQPHANGHDYPYFHTVCFADALYAAYLDALGNANPAQPDKSSSHADSLSNLDTLTGAELHAQRD